VPITPKLAAAIKRYQAKQRPEFDLPEVLISSRGSRGPARSQSRGDERVAPLLGIIRMLWWNTAEPGGGFIRASLPLQVLWAASRRSMGEFGSHGRAA